mgnify:FL=1
MNRPLYKEAQTASLGSQGHRGLWFDRFFNRYQDDWKLGESAKLDWIKTVVGQAGDKSAIYAATSRLRQLCDTLGGETRAFAADWHFTTGLGNPHPVENGFLWHPTLGAPYIPGAAVKGLVRAWVEAWMEFDSKDGNEQRLTTLYRWFGSEDKDFKERRKLRDGGFVPPSGDRKIDTEAGAFIFFDALPTGPVTLKPDVMTPHMGDWYEKGGVDPMNPKVTPADWHDPVPVPFLVADRPKFQFSIAPRNEAARKELEQLFGVLQCALEYLGTGAKTAAGYGRMEVDEKITRAFREEAEQLARKAADASKTDNQRNIDGLRKAFAKQRSLGCKVRAGDALVRQMIGLLDAAVKDTWTAIEKRELADLVATEYPYTLELGKKEKEIKKTLRILRGEDLA